MFYFLYNSTTGQILATNTSGFTPGTGEAVLGPLGSTDTNAVVAYQYPQRFLVQGSPPALVEQPFWSLASTVSSGTYTITATLNNPPTTPPTSATLMVAGGTLTASVSSNQATFTVALHPSIAAQQILATVSALGTVSGTITLGGQTTGVPMKLNPATMPATVVPTGTPGKIQVIQYHLGVSHDAEMWLTLLTAVSAQLPTAWQTTVTNLIVDLTNLGL